MTVSFLFHARGENVQLVQQLLRQGLQLVNVVVGCGQASSLTCTARIAERQEKEYKVSVTEGVYNG